jgi:6-phosphofructo-2-kinase/fructose-2,6-biphosphatase 2
MFAKKLPLVLEPLLGANTKLTVWTSTLKRTLQTAHHLSKWPIIRWKQLDELDSGVCDGMTYEQIEENFPSDFAERDADKVTFFPHFS